MISTSKIVFNVLWHFNMSIVLNSLPIFALEIWTWPQNSSNLWSIIRHFLNRVYLHRKQRPAVTYHFIVFTKIRPKYEQTMYPNLMLRCRDLVSFSGSSRSACFMWIANGFWKIPTALFSIKIWTFWVRMPETQPSLQDFRNVFNRTAGLWK